MGAVPSEVHDLVNRFDRNRDSYKSPAYNEAQVRGEFIDPLFKALGWDMWNEHGYAEAYKDVIHEDAIKVGGVTKAPDYCFRIGGTRKFFLEAKKPAVGIKDDPMPAYQLRRYAWSAKLPLSILTDFEEFAAYDCRLRPHKADKASMGRTLYLRYDEYVDRWDDIAAVFSRDAVLKGSFDKYAESAKRKRGTAEVDDAFLAEIEQWRDMLARNLALRNPGLTQRDLNFAVQRTIDRIVFLRICEDRGIERYGALQALCATRTEPRPSASGAALYARLFERFRRADERYNSGLFHFSRERGRPEEPDDLTPGLTIDDKLLKDILARLYYPESPYEFSVLPADILGQVYEQFLGKVIRLTKGHRAVVEEKPEVRKAGGVYYTPTYIVDYIVKHTVGKLVEGKTPQQVGGLTKSYQPSQAKGVRPLTVLDPACGSGSFLLGAYQFLLDWYRDRYLEDGPEKHATGRSPRLFQHPSGDWRLTTAERKRILLSHIHGVDIDSQAVETTKLSLLLKVLEGESAETIGSSLRLFHERALPDLAANIKCGNSLIGPDFYDHQQMDMFDEEERLRINVFDWQAEFPQVFNPNRDRQRAADPNRAHEPNRARKQAAHPDRAHEPNRARKQAAPPSPHAHRKAVPVPPAQPLSDGRGSDPGPADSGFDAVFGNPPYIPIETMTEAQRGYFQTHFPELERKYDSSVVFILAMLDKLSSVGRLGFISSVTWQTGENYRKLRETLFTRYGVASLVNLPFDVFKAAYVDTGVYVLTRSQQPGYDIYRFAKRARVTELADLPYVRVPTTAVSPPAYKIVLDPQSHSLLARIRQHIPCAELGSFTISTQGLAASRFRRTDSPRNVEHYPFVADGQVYRFALEIRKIDYADMSEFPRLCRFYQAEPKILIRRVINRQDRLVSTYSAENLVFKKDVNPFVISDPSWDCRFVLGVLNSRLVSYLYVNTSSIATKDDFRQTTLAELRRLPLPTVDQHHGPHRRMVVLVQTMLDLHKQLAAAKTAHAKTAIQRQIDATDRQIDQLVYELYGLTDDEIRIVEEATQ